MTEILLFARLLRDAGLAVAMSEIEDAIFALGLVNKPDPGQLHYQVLRATLVKRIEDHPVYDTLYRLFFGDALNKPVSVAVGENTGDPSVSSSGLTANGLSSLANSMLSGNFSPCSANIKLSVRGALSRHGDIHEQVRQAMVNLDYYAAINSLRLANLQGDIPDWNYNQAINQHNVELVRMIEQEIINQRIELGSNLYEESGYLNWRGKNFNLLNQAERLQVKNTLCKIGKRLALRRGLQEKRSNSGKLNFRRTIERGIATGGACVNLVHGKRLPEQPQIILLCDVSNSVYQFTGFMLQLVATFRQNFSRVRAFVFVDKLWSIPSQLLSQDIGTALEEIRENNRCSITGLSDFGRVFLEFQQQVLPIINSKTDLIILGDGKNNWRPLELTAFQEITDKMHRVFWLNPLPKADWEEEDCQIYAYQRFCTGVFECGNLTQLEQIAMKIF